MAGQGNRHRTQSAPRENTLGNWWSGLTSQVPTPPLVRAIEKDQNKGGRGGRPKGSADLRGSVTPGSNQPAASNLGEGIQMQIAERHRAGAGYSAGVTRPNDYPIEARQVLPAEETVVNAAGVTQTGKNLGGGGTPTNMGKTYAALISEMNLQGYGTTPKFGSNQIPLTESSPDQPLSTAGQDVLAGIKAGPATDRTVEGYTQPNYTSINPSDPIFAEAFGQDLADQRIAESGAGNLPGITSSRLSDALKDTASMQGTMSDTPENRRLMARAAMLSDNDIMQNLKVRDAQQGKVYAGGQHYIAGEKEDSPAIAIDRGQARDISSGKTNANALLQAHITKNKDIVKDTPASSQDPAVPFADSPNLKVSKPGAAGYSLTGRDFKLNNDDVASGFGASVNIGNKKGKDYGYTMPGL